MYITERKITLENVFFSIFLFLALIFCSTFFTQEQYGTFCIYALLLYASCFLSFIGQKLFVENTSKKITYLSMLILGSAMAFRAQTGIDDTVYEEIFRNVQGLSLVEYFTNFGIEKGYLFANYILYYLTCGNYNIAQAIISFFTFLLWGYAILNQGIKNINLSIILLLLWSHYYFFMLSAGLVRIFIAIPLVWIALRFVWDKNLKRFIGGIILASLFHISALIMLIFIPFIIKSDYAFKYWKRFVLLLGIVICILFILIARILVPLLGGRYENYSEIQSLTFSFASFDILPIWIIAYFYFRKIKMTSELERKRYIIGMVLLSFSIIFSIASTIVPLGRVIFYSNIGLLIVMSSIFNLKGRQYRGIIFTKMLFIIYALVYVMYTTLLNNVQNTTLFPFKSFL